MTLGKGTDITMDGKQKEARRPLSVHIITGRSHSIEMLIDFLYRKRSIVFEVMANLFRGKKGAKSGN